LWPIAEAGCPMAGSALLGKDRGTIFSAGRLGREKRTERWCRRRWDIIGWGRNIFSQCEVTGCKEDCGCYEKNEVAQQFHDVFHKEIGKW
jgi:hypothetical protein